MEKNYVIIWVSPATQRAGVGKGQFDREEAESLAAELNANHPLFTHIPIDTTVENIQEALAKAKTEVSTPRRDNIIAFPEFGAVDAATREVVSL